MTCQQEFIALLNWHRIEYDERQCLTREYCQR